MGYVCSDRDQRGKVVRAMGDVQVGGGPVGTSVGKGTGDRRWQDAWGRLIRFWVNNNKQ